MTAGYFARVVGTLLFRRTADIMRYLESHQAVRRRSVCCLCARRDRQSAPGKRHRLSVPICAHGRWTSVFHKLLR